MKLKNLFLGSFALTAMLFAQSCDDKNDGPTGAPSIELSTQTLDFEKDGGSQTIKLTATRDWNVTNVPDWIAVDPKSGNPAENKEVTITVLENTGMDRSQDIKFTIGFDGKTLTVNQKGTGSASYTSIKDVREKGSGATLGENTVVCGVVISSKELNNFNSNKYWFFRMKLPVSNFSCLQIILSLGEIKLLLTFLEPLCLSIKACFRLAVLILARSPKSAQVL